MKIEHLLDYGCKEDAPLKDVLKPDHKFTYQAYDPRIARYSASPVPAEMVCCIDYISDEDVLDDLEDLTEKVVFLTINGSLEWWFPKITSRFRLQTLQVVGPDEFYVVGQNAALDLAA